MADKDPYGAIKFGEFRKYMQNKQSKLKEQEAILGNQSEAGIIPVLQGLSIHVNGYTDPPQSELRRLIVQHGGDYQHYLKKSKVTHIIATTLTNSKMNEFRSYKVVKPSWITDSIKEGQVLPWTNYRVINKEGAQKELRFGHHQNAKLPPTLNTPPLPINDLQHHAPRPRLGSSSTKTTSPRLPLSLQLHQSSSTPATHSNALIEPQSIQMEKLVQHTTNMQQQQHQQPDGKELNMALLSNSWNRDNSTTNPDFIKKYYKSSRLHHLSTWKAELKDIVRKAKEQQQQTSSHRSSITLKKKNTRRLVMHVDFDCFFASVGIKSRPELVDSPVAVSHGKGLQKNSSSDIASCNYIARSYGVRNGMRVGKAQELCPDLKIIPYEFKSYRAVSEIFYNILFQYADEIQAVSVDEALLEVGSNITQTGEQQEESLAMAIRNEIREKTGCEASIGMGSNILLARLATKKAKPCNHYYCRPEDVASFLSNQKVEDLPGVGSAMKSKLGEMGVATVGELALVTKSALTSKFGPKTAQTLYNFARGIDDRPLITNQPRQSVSAEVNWGVRFENNDQVITFLDSLSQEVSERLRAIDRKGKSITLKVLTRAKNAGEAIKHLGCGECDSHSKSMVLDSFTDDPNLIAQYSKRALRLFTFLAEDIRGLSIQIQKLNNDDNEDTDAQVDQPKLKFGPQVNPQSPSNNTNETKSSKQKMTIEYNVYMELPEGIRNELNDEYIIEITNNSPPPSVPVTNQSHSIHLPLDQSGVGERISKSDTISKTSASTTLSSTNFLPELPTWSQLDPSALLALPSTMQKEVLESYKSINSAGATGKRHTRSTSPPALSSSMPSKILPPLLRSPSSSTNTNAGKVTKSVHSRHTINAKSNKKLGMKGITLTQMFPRSPNSNIHNNNGNGSDSNTAMATALHNGFGDDGGSPSIGILNDSHNTSLNGMNPRDMEIWSQLPKDIQCELLETYRQEQEQEQKRKRQQTKETAKNICLEPQLPEKQIQPTLMGKSELSEVRELVSAWVHEYPSAPDPKDVETVTNYIKKLVWYKDLEKVQLLVLHLEWITQHNDINKSDWLPVIHNMKDLVSKEMVSVFGAPLV
ncbi:hypothetical protein BC941DRAFT_163223 [Chlamydoabsidia padenii]|nr:hypothetical protein BC941DRAFT_163223 [Chlamydoabsidia padenii]